MTEQQTKKNTPLLVGGIIGLVVLLLIIFGIAESNHLQHEYQAVLPIRASRQRLAKTRRPSAEFDQCRQRLNA